MDLLKIAARIAAIRDIKGKNFDISEFKKLTSSEQILKYAEERLEFLEKGSSRSVFVLSSRKVLKIAMPFRSDPDNSVEAGIAQNQHEVDVYTSSTTKSIVTRIYDFDPEYKWLISELVKPFKSSYEFGKLTNLYFNSMMAYIDDVEKDRIDLNSIPSEYLKFINPLINLTRVVENFDVGDLWQIGHWGKTSDGRVVILDYGLSQDIYEEYYTP